MYQQGEGADPVALQPPGTALVFPWSVGEWERAKRKQS